MSFKNVELKKEANIYFDGNVISHTLITEDGESKTLGVMLVGEYRFNPAAAEVMDMYSGEFEVRFKDSENFEPMSTPCTFNVDANSYFDIKVKTITQYLCSYKS